MQTTLTGKNTEWVLSKVLKMSLVKLNHSFLWHKLDVVCLNLSVFAGYLWKTAAADTRIRWWGCIATWDQACCHNKITEGSPWMWNFPIFSICLFVTFFVVRSRFTIITAWFFLICTLNPLSYSQWKALFNGTSSSQFGQNLLQMALLVCGTLTNTWKQMLWNVMF
jgi:hypothetical protein